MTEIAVGDDRLRMTVRRDDASVMLALQDLATGKTWGPSSLLALEVNGNEVKRPEGLGGE